MELHVGEPCGVWEAAFKAVRAGDSPARNESAILSPTDSTSSELSIQHDALEISG